MSSRLHPVSVTRERKKIHIPEKYHADRDDRREAKEHCLEKHKNVTELEAAYASTQILKSDWKQSFITKWKFNIGNRTNAFKATARTNKNDR